MSTRGLRHWKEESKNHSNISISILSGNFSSLQNAVKSLYVYVEENHKGLTVGGDNRKTQNFKTPTRAIMNNADTRLLTPKSTPYLKIYPPHQFREKINFLQKSTILIINCKKVPDKRIKSIM